jgi:5,5'-dehydrodivanillate O-demethylase
MRRYWHPIAAVSQMNDKWTKKVRLLGEDLILYKDRSGTFGLMEPHCAHRRMNMIYGIPEENGLRCPYHGWLYDETGQCIEQPYEETEDPDARFKDKIQMKAYPVESKGGLLFAYMGPQPAPLVPAWDVYAADGVMRDIGYAELPCNWLQCQENSLDPLHFQWLHRYFGGYMMNRLKPAAERDEWNAITSSKGGDHKKIGFDIVPYGVIKRRLVGDETEDSEFWRIGHPVLFPNILRVAHGMQFRTPMDDTHTLHVTMQFRPYKDGEERQSEVPTHLPSLYDEKGRIRADGVLPQDQLAWVIQGPISDRTTERLGVADVGIILYRRMLDEQARVVEEGGEPINVHRDPSANEIIILPCEYFPYPGYEGTGGPFKDQPVREPDVMAILSGDGADRNEFKEAPKMSGEERYSFK